MLRATANYHSELRDPFTTDDQDSSSVPASPTSAMQLTIEALEATLTIY